MPDAEGGRLRDLAGDTELGAGRNAGLLAVAILGNSRQALREQLRAFRVEQTRKVRQVPLP